MEGQPPHPLCVRWLTSFILLACDLGTRELLGAQEIGGGSASVATGYDLSGLRATHSDLLASGAWSANPAGETSQARGRPVVNWGSHGLLVRPRLFFGNVSGCGWCRGASGCRQEIRIRKSWNEACSLQSAACIRFC